ncbi:MAG: RlmE family RNA methyltransferase [Alphaproteobacteria bacterium]
MSKKGKGSVSDRRYKTVRVKTARRRSNSSARWLDRQLNDPYVMEAKRMGLRSRAAFKIQDIQEKYNIIQPDHKIVDLGCAPGGWTQVALQIMNNKGKVVGIDLLEVEPIPGAILLQGDFTDDDAPELIKKELDGKVNGVLSDMAANTTGHKATDHLRIIALVEMALYFALEILKKDGYFVAKVFSGGTESELLKTLKHHFTKVFHYKPPSSRKDSPEMYVIATGFKDNFDGTL